jgi:type II secretory pathway pseudopilin PulG
MTLTEILVAASLLAISASASLQVWASGSRWSVRSEQWLQQQQALEAELVAVQARLQGLAGAPAGGDCDVAADWLVSHLPGLQRQGEGVLLRLAGPEGSERQRWYDPAVYGLCAGEAAAPATDGITADPNA